MCGVQYSAYEVVAEGYGAVGVVLGRDNESDMERVLMEAQSTSRSSSSSGGGRSVLINCLIGRTSFRDGSISV